jgi:alcohol dehydrogenase, propanol-preferring
VVIGAGGPGQFAIQYLRLLTGARVVAVDTAEAKRRRAVALGADEAIAVDGAARTDSATRDERGLRDERGHRDDGACGTNGARGELPPAQVVFDFVGTSATLGQAVATVVPAGLVILVGETGGRVPFGFTDVPHEACLTTSVWGSRADLEAVLGHARRGELTWDVEPIPLDRANEALARLREGDVTGRIVLVP